LDEQAAVRDRPSTGSQAYRKAGWLALARRDEVCDQCGDLGRAEITDRIMVAVSSTPRSSTPSSRIGDQLRLQHPPRMVL